ncbi:MAG: entericidin A/B family lipoprotein [Halopseudomonas sp.]
MKKTLMMLVATLFGIAVLSGCNTVEGFGEDVQQVGEGMQDSAN